MPKPSPRVASAPSRYRLEGGVPTVDIKVHRIEQLFDNRDPAPFRDRDLDPDLVEYLLDAGEDLEEVDAYRVVFWLEEAGQPGEVEQALRSHFVDLLARNQRRHRRRRREGKVALLVAVVLVIAVLALAQVVGSVIPGSLGAGLREGLVILGWVVMWRPIEVLIYDWIPVRHERRLVSKLLRGAIEVRVGKGPVALPATTAAGDLGAFTRSGG